MSESESGQEKTEEPTEKKIQDAREKGEVARSREVTAATVTIAGFGYLAILGVEFKRVLETTLSYFMTKKVSQVVEVNSYSPIFESFIEVAVILGGLLLVTFFAAIGSQFFLGRFNFSLQALIPKGSKLNPISGLKRMFGLNGIVEMGKAVLKVILLGVPAGALVTYFYPDIIELGLQHLSFASSEAINYLWILIGLLLAGFVAIAGIDVPWQIHQHHKKLKMTLQEVRDELRQTEGQPEVRARIRQMQIEAAKRNLSIDVSEADVVITNPTEFAVAIKYDTLSDSAPVVVAKGQGEIAGVVKELARENNVPILEYPVLARALYFTSKVGEHIVEDLYSAVALVLAYVFNVVDNNEIELPDITVPKDVQFDEFGQRVA